MKKLLEKAMAQIPIPTPPHRTYLTNLSEGADAIAVHRLWKRAEHPMIFIARDDRRAERIIAHLKFIDHHSASSVIYFPAWDCLPFDRAAPNRLISALRVQALCKLAERQPEDHPPLVITTINSLTQKIPPLSQFIGKKLLISKGQVLDRDQLIAQLQKMNYQRCDKVHETGEYSVRGHLLDIYPCGMDNPVRIDFFDDEVESLRWFDPMTQRTFDDEGDNKTILTEISLIPTSELLFNEERCRQFRIQYRRTFGSSSEKDPMYQSIAEGIFWSGMEHWLPLFFGEIYSLPSQLSSPVLIFDDDVELATQERFDLIADCYHSRLELSEEQQIGSHIYRPLKPDQFYLGQEEWDNLFNQYSTFLIKKHDHAISNHDKQKTFSCNIRYVEDFTAARHNTKTPLIEAVKNRILAKQNKPTLIAAYSEGSRDRMNRFLIQADLAAPHFIEGYEQIANLKPTEVGLIILDLEFGYENSDFVLYTEREIFGNRQVRPKKRKRSSSEIISEASSLNLNDLVVHIEHGIGRYEGLLSLDINGAPHDCLKLSYAGGDRLFLPVENIELLSRYGNSDETAQLDRLGSDAWQARKAKIKERLKMMADKLLAIAAERELKSCEQITPEEVVFEEFCARFDFEATDDQERTINEVLADLNRGKPMDRLVCGDVGFGKTEIALRAAFVVAMTGQQVAVVCPTTILARQHYKTFSERFKDLPVRIAQLSRLVSAKDAKLVKKQIETGQIDIVIGTHALLAKTMKFSHLGMAIVDEEQHFGVAQKERLKSLRSQVHFLTLSATPIPRTLQMALSGVRSLSLIATPPIDRLAVRTFATQFDPVTIKEAIRRERFRGGQIFCVCPRIADIPWLEDRIANLVPDVKIEVAHGQLPPQQLEDVMQRFIDGEVDLLISTNIVESGLDIPNANTLIIHRADRFGLSQLYQLRGRIGRSKARAYCYLTWPHDRPLSPSAHKRLDVMQTLDGLGAGFTLASHDMDMRGAGNLLGEEQSGHIREVGIELYQKMLEAAVAKARQNKSISSGELVSEVPETDEADPAHQHSILTRTIVAHDWSPQINVGLAISIPEDYVPDLPVRLALYRRCSQLEDEDEIDDFRMELIDRFGAIPEQVENLFQILKLKGVCRIAHIERLDVGTKGAVITFHDGIFPNPQGLVDLIQKQKGNLILQPNQKLTYISRWEAVEQRMRGAFKLTHALKRIALNI